MTWQALLFLYQCKSVQVDENRYIWLDENNRKMQTVMESTEDKSVEKNLSRKWSSIRPLLKYLKQEGFIESRGEDYFALTYSGYHYIQAIISSVLDFLIKSVGVPIAVSILTSIFSLRFFGII